MYPQKWTCTPKWKHQGVHVPPNRNMSGHAVHVHVVIFSLFHLMILFMGRVRCFWQSEIQTSLGSYGDKLEQWNFACSKFWYDTFQLANNKGANQTAHMCRLVCSFVVRKPPKTGFLVSSPIFKLSQHVISMKNIFNILMAVNTCN